MAQRKLARILAGLVLGALVVASGSARADERTEARSHFKKGMAEIADGKYDVGIEELKKAYDILPHPNVLYNIARAYVDMGDLENAVAYYRKYLEGNPKDRDEVAQIVAASRRASASSRRSSSRRRRARARAAPAPAERPPAAPAARARRHRWTGPGDAARRRHRDGPGHPARRPARGARGPTRGRAEDRGRLRGDRRHRVEGARRAPSTRRTPPRSSPSRTSASRASRRSPSSCGASPASTSWRSRARRPRCRSAASTSACRTRCSSSSTAAASTSTSSAPRSGQTLSIGVEDIERIEVVRGPGSALYGADAFNGVINIITKTPGRGQERRQRRLRRPRTRRTAASGRRGRDKEFAYRALGRLRLPAALEPRGARRAAPTFTSANADQDAAQRTVRLDVRRSRASSART